MRDRLLVAVDMDGTLLDTEDEDRLRPREIAALEAVRAAGHVVACFHGGMEYGPRALGHRTILYQTTDPSVNDWLNQRLQRTEFMPFAPATLASEARRCYHDLDGAEDPARFMTVTFKSYLLTKILKRTLAKALAKNAIPLTRGQQKYAPIVR